MQPNAPSPLRMDRRLLLSQIALLGLLGPAQMAEAQQIDAAEPVVAAKGLIEGAHPFSSSKGARAMLLFLTSDMVMQRVPQGLPQPSWEMSIRIQLHAWSYAS